VFPQDVERVILSHPKVKECAVFGVENDYFGEVVCALIVPKEPLTERELRNFLRTKLVSYQMPLYVDFVETIPKSHLGKVVRKDLKKMVNKERLNRTVEKLKTLLL
jgi:acyl-coenzyme A synthetase/AMP-(fatty) acid ligase